jgi:hypothetical protein
VITIYDNLDFRVSVANHRIGGAVVTICAITATCGSASVIGGGTASGSASATCHLDQERNSSMSDGSNNPASGFSSMIARMEAFVPPGAPTVTSAIWRNADGVKCRADTLGQELRRWNATSAKF